VSTAEDKQSEKTTSIHALRRSTLFLLKSAIVVFTVALLFVLFNADESNPILSDRNRVILFTPILMVFFVGAIFIFPIGWFKTVKWMFVMAFNVRKEVPAYKYWFNAFNTVFCPSYLTPKGLEARASLLDALKWLGAGSLLILLVFLMQYFAGTDF
jgi:hypothetical protein